MTARADRLTHGARTPDNAGSVRSSYPASSLRVFVGALERLDYRMAPLLAQGGTTKPIWMTRTRASRVKLGSGL